MKNKIKLIVLLLTLLINSCNNEQIEQKTDSLKANLNYETAFNIVQNKYLITPDTVVFAELNGTKYLSFVKKEEFNRKIYILSNFADTWQEVEIINGLFNVVDLRLTSIDSIDYVFYADESSGNTMGLITFVLRKIETKEEYFISFDGYAYQYDRLGPVSKRLKAKKNILKYLEERAKESPYVYNPSPSDYNVNLYTNYDKKWNILNAGLRENLLNNSNATYDIQFPYYYENLFDSLGHGIKIKKVENNKYIIISYFKDNVIGYDKIKKKYFALWIPDLIYNWIENLELDDEHILIMELTSEFKYKVDLLNKKIKRIVEKDKMQLAIPPSNQTSPELDNSSSKENKIIPEEKIIKYKSGGGYEIDWGGKGTRKIYNFHVPTFPEEISKEADIRLRFTILPDGTVGTVMILTTADTRLENTAINALKQWRFEPLPSGQKQLEQPAIMVFR